jgi:surfeit locus 1 family protein
LSTPSPISASAPPKPPRSSWKLIGFFIPALIVFAALIGLGTWQLQRKAWKEELIATLNERLAAAPVALPAPATWPALNRDDTEYRRVAFTGTFDDSKEALVYAAASAFRPDVSGPGYWVFTPARLTDGSVVIVNRGFVPQDLANPSTRPAGHLSGPIEITGTLRWPDARSWFAPSDDPSHNLWFLRDPAAIAAAKGLNKDSKPVAPFYVEQESPVPPGGFPQPGRLKVRLRNEHLQYVVTWYGLALVLVVICTVWARSSVRSAGQRGRPEVADPTGSARESGIDDLEQ